MKLKRATYRHIEAEIYSYCDTVKVIEELRRDIILANGRQEAYGAVVGGRYADLGAERQRDWVQEYIYRLINERYEKMLPAKEETMGRKPLPKKNDACYHCDKRS